MPPSHLNLFLLLPVVGGVAGLALLAVEPTLANRLGRALIAFSHARAAARAEWKRCWETWGELDREKEATK